MKKINKKILRINDLVELEQGTQILNKNANPNLISKHYIALFILDILEGNLFNKCFY